MDTPPIREVWYEIRNVNLYYPVTGTVEYETSMVFHDGQVVEIGGQTDATNNVVRVDGGGRWVLPALVDCHVHPAVTGNSFENAMAHGGPMERMGRLGSAQTHANLREAFASGVMAVRDMGTPASVLDELSSYRNGEAYPIVTSCVQPITGPKGHLSSIAREISEKAHCETTVADLQEAGADHVKVANDPITIPRELLSELVKAANNRDMPVACHAHTREAIRIAVQAGCDTVEHGFPPSSELARMANKNKTVFVPTYYCSDVSLLDEAITTVPESQVHTFVEWKKNLDSFVEVALKHNLPIAIGTDAGLPPVGFDAVWKEVVALANLGFDAEQLLRSATIIGARVLGYEDEWTIKEGETAFLTIVESDPRETLQTLRTAQPLIFDGKPIPGVSDPMPSGVKRTKI